MRVFLTIGLLLMVGMAGCADDGPKVADADDEAFNDLAPSDVSSGKGLIRGIVIDTAITPLADATVTLVGNDLTATTTENGAFLFTDLDPGAYFLQVTKPGYAKVQASALVEADIAKPEIIKIALVEVPGTLPRIVTLVTEGYIGCSVKVANIVQDNVCGIAGGIDPDKNEPLSWGEAEMPDTAQTEIQWSSNQALGTWLSMIQYMVGEGGNVRVGNVWGPSPVVCRITIESQCDNGDGTGGGGVGMGEAGWTDAVRPRMFASCTDGCIIGAVGYGAVLQQKYSMFGTVFYNVDAAEDWTFSKDGPHPVPN